MLKVIIDERVFSVSEEKSITCIDGNPIPIDLLEYRKDKFHILFENKSFTAELISIDRDTKSMVVKVNNSTMELRIQDEYDELLSQMGIDQASGTKVNNIKAPMPGMVLNVLVEIGQDIKKGDPIVVLEAMKMENILKSPADGKIRKVFVKKGDKVEKNQIMVNLD
jgi:biotin carboxyl carrier protein